MQTTHLRGTLGVTVVAPGVVVTANINHISKYKCKLADADRFTNLKFNLQIYIKTSNIIVTIYGLSYHLLQLKTTKALPPNPFICHLSDMHLQS